MTTEDAPPNKALRTGSPLRGLQLNAIPLIWNDPATTTISFPDLFSWLTPLLLGRSEE